MSARNRLEANQAAPHEPSSNNEMTHAMSDPRCTRRDFSIRLANWAPTLGVLGASLAASRGPVAAGDAAPADGVSHAAEAIHQEVVFQASPQRIYAALTEARQFDKIVDLSGIRQSGMLPAEANKPTRVSPEAGSTFTLFGGYITGRQIELVPNVRIVEAWRAANWAPGVYSIAKFELVEQGTATKIVFDQTGFPTGAGKSLAAGWHKHYWGPLTKLLSLRD
jgi:activator of HSP90 ATPase